MRIVSNKLADGDIEGLSEMVTSDVLREIQQNLPKFSVGQRQELIVEPDDIYFATPTSIMLNNGKRLSDSRNYMFSLRNHFFFFTNDLSFQIAMLIESTLR